MTQGLPHDLPKQPSPGDDAEPEPSVVSPDHPPHGYDIFVAAVQMSSMPMLLTDPHQPDNPIVFCNPAFERLTGYQQSEVVGRNCRLLQGPATDPAAVQRLREAIARQGQVHEELWNYRKDGSGFWSAVFISPVIGPDRKLRYYFGSQLEVTARREAEAALHQAQHLEALGGMASGLAHEFNNLMTIVLGSLSQLGREVASPQGRQQLERAEWGVQQASRLTQQMLTFARHQFHDEQVVDLGQAVTDFDTILRQAAGGDVTVELQLAAVPLPVRLDPGQLELALLNLVRNAVDAMPAGGQVVVRTAEHIAEELVEIAVADTGSGIAPELVGQVVEPFFTTKERGRGTGLGLAMVNGFVTQMRGRLHIETELGRSTSVRLLFPRYDTLAATGAEAPSSSAG